MNIPSRFLLSALLCLGANGASATNIVQNPSFEQGSAGWEHEHFVFLTNPMWAHSGPGSARLTVCSNAAACLDELFDGAYVSQLLDTTPGELYNMSFWVRSFTGESRISVFWDGVELLKTPTPNGPMVQYTFSGLAVSAAATLLEVHGYNSANKYMSFDDFSVLQVAAPPPAVPNVPIPEPGVYPLVLAALGGMLLARRRRG